MSTPIMTGDPAMQAYLAEQYHRLHYQSYFQPDPAYSKREARSIAFMRMIEARRQGKI